MAGITFCQRGRLGKPRLPGLRAPCKQGAMVRQAAPASVPQASQRRAEIVVLSLLISVLGMSFFGKPTLSFSLARETQCGFSKNGNTRPILSQEISVLNMSFFEWDIFQFSLSARTEIYLPQKMKYTSNHTTTTTTKNKARTRALQRCATRTYYSYSRHKRWKYKR